MLLLFHLCDALTPFTECGIIYLSRILFILLFICVFILYCGSIANDKSNPLFISTVAILFANILGVTEVTHR